MNAAVQTLIFRPRPILLADGSIRREPTRPIPHRPSTFDDEFDFSTLAFDIFFRGPTEVLLTAPPFFNLRPFVERMRVIALPSGRSCAFKIREMDRHAQIRVAVTHETTGLRLQSQLGDFSAEPQRHLFQFFAGKRVLFTKSKNNRIDWITDWVRYHRDIHGANALLLYDNGSTVYSCSDLLAEIAKLSGIDCVCIVDWPFRFGPQGFGSRHFWDSDFCELGICEHARWMFLQDARSVLHGDIDELVVSERGASVFTAAERSWLGVISYHGYWVHGFKGITREASNGSPIRVVDFDHYLRQVPTRRGGFLQARDTESVCPPKWTAVPRRCPIRAQWTSHRIKNWLNALPINSDFSYRHFREINNHWKYDRSVRETFDNARYAFDMRMRANFAAVQWTS